VSRRFVITWSLFASLWAAWVLSSNLSMDRLAPLFAEAPPVPDHHSSEEDGYAEALTAYAISSMERDAALEELWSLVARAFGPPVLIVVLLVIADMGAHRDGGRPGRHGPRQAWVAVAPSRAVRIALLLWLVLSALWLAALVLRTGSEHLVSSPDHAFGPPIMALMIGLFLYGISLPVRERG
jgi:hypothetical protein